MKSTNKTIKLSDIFSINKKSKIKAGDGLSEGLYPLYTSSMFITKYLNSYDLDINGLVFGTGGMASIHYASGKFSVSTDCYVMVPCSDDVNIKYVYYYLKGNLYILENGFKGAGLKHISKDYLNNIEIPIPPLSEQKRIVSILDKSIALIEKRREAIELLDEYLKSVFIDMFGDLNKNTKKWSFKEFGDYITILTDYHANGSYEVLRDHVKLLSDPDYALMVRTTDLENNNFSDGVKYISKDAYDFLEKSKIYGGEIIINKIGSAGNVYLMPDLNRPVSLGMNAFLVRFTSEYNNIFVYHLLKSYYGRSIIKTKIKGAVTKTIRKDAVRELMVPEVPIEIQNEFVRIINNINSLKLRMLEQLNTLEKEFQVLLNSNFSYRNNK